MSAKLADEFGEHIENKIRYLNVIHGCNLDLQSKELALEEAYKRVATWPVVELQDAEEYLPGVLVTYVSVVVLHKASRFLEQGKHNQASATLEAAWPSCSRFLSDYIRNRAMNQPQGKGDRAWTAAGECSGFFGRLRFLMLQWEECAALAQQDPSLDPGMKASLVSKYKSTAEDLRRESDLAFQAWLGYFKESKKFQSNPGKAAREFSNDLVSFEERKLRPSDKKFVYIPASEILNRFLVSAVQEEGDLKNLTSKGDWSKAYKVLGKCYFECEFWSQSAEALETADLLADGQDFAHRLYLAVCYCHLGKLAEAKKCYIEGSAWLQEKSDERLEELRADVERLLGISEDGR